VARIFLGDFLWLGVMACRRIRCYGGYLQAARPDLGGLLAAADSRTARPVPKANSIRVRFLGEELGRRELPTSNSRPPDFLFGRLVLGGLACGCGY